MPNTDMKTKLAKLIINNKCDRPAGKEMVHPIALSVAWASYSGGNLTLIQRTRNPVQTGKPGFTAVTVACFICVC